MAIVQKLVIIDNCQVLNPGYDLSNSVSVQGTITEPYADIYYITPEKDCYIAGILQLASAEHMEEVGFHVSSAADKSDTGSKGYTNKDENNRYLFEKLEAGIKYKIAVGIIFDTHDFTKFLEYEINGIFIAYTLGIYYE